TAYQKFDRWAGGGSVTTSTRLVLYAHARENDVVAATKCYAALRAYFGPIFTAAEHFVRVRNLYSSAVLENRAATEVRFTLEVPCLPLRLRKIDNDFSGVPGT
ncbi:unnamed protein product, partial [Scytosiphon promiscuus]